VERLPIAPPPLARVPARTSDGPRWAKEQR